MARIVKRTHTEPHKLVVGGEEKYLLMAVHEIRLLRRETVAEGTMAFHFSKPAGFGHQAGQSLTMTLVNPPETDGKGDSRTFTIASAPHESDFYAPFRYDLWARRSSSTA